MDRSFLYGVIVLLAITDGLIYIQKTDPSLLSKFMPFSSSHENWQSKDPGWNVKPDAEKKDSKPETKPESDKSDKKSEAKPEQDQEESAPKSRHFKLFRCRP